MFNFLDELRQKPETHRRTFAVTAALGITFVIAGVWLSVQDFNFSHQIVVEDDKSQMASPFSVIKEDLENIFNDAAEEMQEMEEGTTPEPDFPTNEAGAAGDMVIVDGENSATSSTSTEATEVDEEAESRGTSSVMLYEVENDPQEREEEYLIRDDQ